MDDVRICTHRPLWTNLSCQRVWDWKMSRMKLWLSCVLLYSCMWCWTTSASSSCSGALLQKYFGYQFSGREYVSPQIFSLFSWVTILFLETVIFCSDSFGMSCLEVPGIKHILEVSSHRTWAQICPCFSIKGSVFFCGGWPCFVGHPPFFSTPRGTLRPPPPRGRWGGGCWVSCLENSKWSVAPVSVGSGAPENSSGAQWTSRLCLQFGFFPLKI